jgi:osmotically-inducible protein OsmY
MRILSALSIASLLFVASCSRHEVSKIEATGKDNANLERAIRTRLASDVRVQDAALTITANAEKSEVILSGSVPSEESRGRAVELTQDVQSGLLVIDHIEVRPAEIARGEYTEIMAKRAREKAVALGDHIGNSLDDAWVYTKVITKLAAEQGVPAIKINVDVTDSVVTLRGQVDSEARKMEAEHVVAETSGVKRVNNLLKVQGV